MSFGPTYCACGYSGEDGTIPMFSVEWEVGHKAQHLRTFPNVDKVTEDNLNQGIAYARKVKAEGLGPAPRVWGGKPEGQWKAARAFIITSLVLEAEAHAEDECAPGTPEFYSKCLAYCELVR